MTERTKTRKRPNHLPGCPCSRCRGPGIEAAAAEAFLDAMEAEARQQPYVVTYGLGRGAELHVTQDKCYRDPKTRDGCVWEFRYAYVQDGRDRLLSRSDALTLLREGRLPEQESYEDLFREMHRQSR